MIAFPNPARQPTTHAASRTRRERAIDLAMSGELPKNIGTQLGMSDGGLRNLLRTAGFRAVFLSPEEQALIAARRKAAVPKP